MEPGQEKVFTGAGDISKGKGACKISAKMSISDI